MKTSKYYYIEWKHYEKEGNLRMAAYYKDMYHSTTMTLRIKPKWDVKKLKQFPMIYLN